MEVAGDVIGGWNIKETLKDRGLAGIKRTFAEIVDQSPPDKQRLWKKKVTAGIADKLDHHSRNAVVSRKVVHCVSKKRQ